MNLTQAILALCSMGNLPPVLSAEGSPFRVIGWSAALLILLVVGWLVVAWVKKWMATPDETQPTGFTLSDLRRLHRGGQMTDDEFERAKEAIVGATRRAAERDD